MASMRVHELAKEFDMTSKELLDRLHEMKIPAKSHASMLADAYVDKIRKNLSPEIKQRAGKIDAEEAKQLAEEKAQEERKKAEECIQQLPSFHRIRPPSFIIHRSFRIISSEGQNLNLISAMLSDKHLTEVQTSCFVNN